MGDLNVAAPTTTRPNAHPFRSSFAMAVPFIIVASIIGFAVIRPDSSYESGAIVGSVLGASVIIGAPLTGLIARSSHSPWSHLRYAVTVAGISIGFLLVRLLAAASAASA